MLTMCVARPGPDWPVPRTCVSRQQPFGDADWQERLRRCSGWDRPCAGADGQRSGQKSRRSPLFIRFRLDKFRLMVPRVGVTDGHAVIRTGKGSGLSIQVIADPLGRAAETYQRLV